MGGQHRELRPSEPCQHAAVSFRLQALLDLPITLSFRQESLESALAGLEEVVREKLRPARQLVRLELDGRALQLEGITRNQQLRNFQAIDMPAPGRLEPDRGGGQPGSFGNAGSRTRLKNWFGW